MQQQYTFFRRTSRTRMVAMVIASLCVHGVLVGAGALYHPPVPPAETVTELGTDTQIGDQIQELIVPEDQPQEESTPDPTPPPDPTPDMEDTPPPPDKDPDFVEATPAPTPEQKPKDKTPPKPAGTPPPPNAKRGPVGREGVVGGVPQETVKKTGTPGGKVIGNWKTSNTPPYPYQARAQHLQGSGVIRIHTDGSGHVVSAEMVQSINPILDNSAKQAARGWSGPPNSSTTVPITYQLR